MAIVFVKNGGTFADKSNPATPQPMTITVPAGGHAAGNLVAIFVGSYGASQAISGVSDTRGNTYTAVESNTADISAYIFVSVLGTALQAGDTITVTASVTPAREAISAMEFSGCAITEDVASARGSNVVAGQPTAGAITPPSAETLMLGFFLAAGSTTITEDSDTAGGAGWNAGPLAQTSSGSAASNIVSRAAYKITSSSASQTYNPTLGTARGWGAAIVSLQPSGPTGYLDSATVTLALQASGSELIEAIETVTVPLALLASGSELQAKDYTETATVLVDLQASGTEFLGHEYLETATVLIDLQASGSDIYTAALVSNIFCFRPIIVGGQVIQDRSRW